MNDGMNHIDCEQADQMVDRYISGELPPDERRLFDAHLAGCTSCSELLHSLESVRSVVRRTVGSQSAPATLRAGVRGMMARERAAVNTPPNPLSRGGLRKGEGEIMGD